MSAAHELAHELEHDLAHELALSALHLLPRRACAAHHSQRGPSRTGNAVS